MKLIRLLLLMIGVSISLSATTLLASEDAEKSIVPDLPKYVMPEETLKGVRSVQVLIEYLDKDAIEGGLTREILQTDVELKLRIAGINVYDEETIPDLTKDWDEWVKWYDDYIPEVALYINLCVKKIYDYPMYAMALAVEVHETGVLTRGQKKIQTTVTTWSTGSISTVGADKFRQGARQSVKDSVDLFINEYLKMNPN